MLAVVCLPLPSTVRPALNHVALAFFAGIAVHLLLDSVAGDIKWLWPCSDRFFHLITIPASHSHWMLNFILHPVFLLEIMIWFAAPWLLLRRPVQTDATGTR